MATEIEVFGKVQRVGFREYIRGHGKQLGLNGRTYNRRDGSVYALVDGPEEAVKKLLSVLRRGPIKARVKHVEHRHVDEIVPKGFTIDEFRIFGDSVLRMQRTWLKEALPDSIYNYGTLGHKETSHFLLKGLRYTIPQVYGSSLVPEKALQIIQKRGSGFIKPVKASASRGCIGLAMDGPFYLNVMTGEIWSEGTVLEWMENERTRFGFANSWRVEELLEGHGFSLPRDIKFYCFAGTIKLISIMERIWDEKLSLNMQWFTKDWEPLSPPPAHSTRIDTSIKPLDEKERIVYETKARDISKRTLLPFTRVDLYETPSGPIAGELTPDPASAFAFTPEWHTYFMKEWKAGLKQVEKYLLSLEGMAVIEEHKRIAKSFQRKKHG